MDELKNLTYKNCSFEEFQFTTNPGEISPSWFGKDTLVIYAKDPETGKDFRIEVPWRDINQVNGQHSYICYSC